MFFQFSDGNRTIRCIYSKTIAGSDNDKVSFTCQYIVRHLIETIALFCVITGNFCVRIYFYVFQVIALFNVLCMSVNFLDRWQLALSSLKCLFSCFFGSPGWRLGVIDIPKHGCPH